MGYKMCWIDSIDLIIWISSAIQYEVQWALEHDENNPGSIEYEAYTTSTAIQYKNVGFFF